MKKIEIRPDGSRRVYTINQEPGKTDPSYAKECDANHIIQKYLATGQITHTARKQGSYADVSNVPDLLTAHSKIQASKRAFDQLPSEVQDRFKTPDKLLGWLENPKNWKEAQDLGLLTIRDESGTILKESSATKRKRGRSEDAPEEQPGGMDADGTRSPRGKAPQEQKTSQQPK